MQAGGRGVRKSTNGEAQGESVQRGEIDRVGREAVERSMEIKGIERGAGEVGVYLLRNKKVAN